MVLEGSSWTKKVLPKLNRAVSKEHISQYHQPSPLPESPLIEALGLFPKATMTALLAAFPRLDHSIRLLLDTLDVSTVFLSSHALMHPLSWPHVYLPVIPRRMHQYLECPTPLILVLKNKRLKMHNAN
ncbi:hypothetical protein PsorP6_002103 [Peronosclerospora sorghi]|uniref:Uncharacterized protein n=1 Tax=Peronosclerospora sorghi TaxID=230839 RepID=A0ACC0WQP2_9STRA|nr:hypothetical protein PsorP6_002103 [Peronosclerospora sorghi]